MPPVAEYTFTRYLAAKKSVDDRALNGHVWEILARAVGARAAPDQPVRVLEIGAGIGTMLERALERGLFTSAVYLALDDQADNIAAAGARLPRWAAGRGFQVAAGPQGLRLARGAACVGVDLRVDDLLEFSARPEQRGAWDLLIAHAVLDLLDLPSALPRLLGVLRPGGLFYFSLNFDGATLFQPEIDPALDVQIEALYHRTMDERIAAGRPSGDSRTGRHLFGHLRRQGVELLAAGGSDWVVFASEPASTGGKATWRYPADEAYFLHFIVHTVDSALRGHPELDAARFAAWVAERHAQIERGELVYLAHQLDFVGRTTG
jgi:SAM-dependent methyltransferase